MAPAELENLIRGIPGVTDVAVIGGYYLKVYLSLMNELMNFIFSGQKIS